MFTAQLFKSCFELIPESGNEYRSYGWSYGVWLLKSYVYFFSFCYNTKVFTCFII